MAKIKLLEKNVVEHLATMRVQVGEESYTNIVSVTIPEKGHSGKFRVLSNTDLVGNKESLSEEIRELALLAANTYLSESKPLVALNQDLKHVTVQNASS